MQTVSCSHWGVFERRQPLMMVVPKGFEIDPTSMAELKRPDGLVPLLPYDGSRQQIVMLSD